MLWYLVNMKMAKLTLFGGTQGLCFYRQTGGHIQYIILRAVFGRWARLWTCPLYIMFSRNARNIFPYFDHHSNAEPKCLSLASSLNWQHLRPRVKRTPSFQPLWTWNLGTLTHSDKNTSISYKLNCAEVNSLVSNTFLYTYFRTIFFVQKIEENCVFNLPETLNVVTLSLFIITSLSFHCCFTLDKDRLSNGLPNKVKWNDLS